MICSRVHAIQITRRRAVRARVGPLWGAAMTKSYLWVEGVLPAIRAARMTRRRIPTRRQHPGNAQPQAMLWPCHARAKQCICISARDGAGRSGAWAVVPCGLGVFRRGALIFSIGSPASPDFCGRRGSNSGTVPRRVEFASGPSRNCQTRPGHLTRCSRSAPASKISSSAGTHRICPRASENCQARQRHAEFINRVR